MPTQPRDALSQITIRRVFGLVCLAIAIWGIWFCRDLVHSPAIAGPYPSLNDLVAVVGWLVLFGPFAIAGLYSLFRAWKNFQRAQAERQFAEPVTVLPPIYNGPMPPRQLLPPEPSPRVPITEPLDDATRRHLDQVASRAARITGTVFGSLLLLGGIAGLTLAWIQTHRPPSGLARIHFGLKSFRITVYFLVSCGVSVLLGLYILRETFSKPKTGWLVPLQVFGAIVQRKSKTEQSQKKLPPLSLPATRPLGLQAPLS